MECNYSGGNDCVMCNGVDEIEKYCPKCGSKLVLRKATKGSNAGRNFYGCSAFPKCRYIENI